MSSRVISWSVVGLLIILFCMQPAFSDIPNAFSYAQYVTLIHDQSKFHGGCQGYSATHVLEILKEMEFHYTPDPSYAFHDYVWTMGTKQCNITAYPHDPRVETDLTLGSYEIMAKYGAAPETSYRTDFDYLGETYCSLVAPSHRPSDTAFDEALAYRVIYNGDDAITYSHQSVAQTEDLLYNQGPLVCDSLFRGHAVALIGYNRTTSNFTIVDSADWQDVDHAGIKEVTYAYYQGQIPNITLHVMTNSQTPLIHPYTARINISHAYRRSMLTVTIGAVGEKPLVVWYRNNKYSYTDKGQDLVIDVPLPDYAAAHWPPSEQNTWSVIVHNADTWSGAVLNEVTLVKRGLDPGTGNPTYEIYQQKGLPRTIPPVITSTFLFPNSVTVQYPNGGETWYRGVKYPIRWKEKGLSGTNVKIELYRDGQPGPVRTITPSTEASKKVFTWQVPSDLEPGGGYKIMIVSLTDPLINDMSDTSFTVSSIEANFTANPTNGFAPLTVQFTDTSVGNPKSWFWNFGDSKFSHTQSPSHSYTKPGTYLASLRISDPAWPKTYSTAMIITVQEPLNPGFSVYPRIGYEPFTVKFKDETTGTVAYRNWDFGDGTSSSEKNPVHTYQNDGAYTVVLTISNPVAGTKTATKTDYIQVLPLHNGLIKIQAEDYQEGGEGVAYHDTTPGNSGVVYRTDDVDIVPIGRNEYAVTDTQNTEWTSYQVFRPVGMQPRYPITLHVANGGLGKKTIRVTPAKRGGGTVVTIPNTGSDMTFVDVSTTVQLKNGWNEVRMFYTGGPVNFDYFTINPAGVNPKPTPTPTQTPITKPVIDFVGVPRNGTAPLSVQFYDASSGTGITGYSWVLSDSDTVYTTHELSHTFENPGTYDVSHSATNSAGTAWKNVTQYVTVDGYIK